MAELIKSEALILRRFRHGDTSLVIHAFTREKGRVPFIAKGARIGGKRAPVPLIPVVLLEFVWSPSIKSELQLLREVSLVDGFGPIHQDFEHLAWAQAAIETLGRTLTGEEPYEELFSETVSYLKSLAESGGRPENLLYRFRLKALQELGYGINLAVPEESSAQFYFSAKAGRVFTRKNKVRGAIPVGLGAWKLLGAVGRSGYGEVQRLRIPAKATDQIESILDAAYRHAFERWAPLESLKLLDLSKQHGGLDHAALNS